MNIKDGIIVSVLLVCIGGGAAKSYGLFEPSQPKEYSCDSHILYKNGKYSLMNERGMVRMDGDNVIETSMTNSYQKRYTLPEPYKVTSTADEYHSYIKFDRNEVQYIRSGSEMKFYVYTYGFKSSPIDRIVLDGCYTK